MEHVHAVDFVVVGSGMAGASIAAYLSQQGRVAILETEAHVGYHSTGRSAAFFSANYGSAVIRALTRASRKFFFDPPTGFASVDLCRRRDCMFLARIDQLDLLRHFREDADVRAATRELSAAQAIACLPLLREDYVAGALLESGCGDLDVDAIHQGFLRQARKHGAALHLSSPVQALRRADGRWIARTPSAAFSAPVLVNAAGAWGDELARLAGLAPVGLQPMRRTATLVPVPDGLAADDWPFTVDIAEEFYFKPDAGLLLVSPADEHASPPCDAQPEELDVAIGIDRFERATGTQVRQVRRSWAGLRVFAPDRAPVVGFDPDAPGFFWLVGQGGYGIQTAPALGRLAAALATGQPIPEDIAREGVAEHLLGRARLAAAHEVSPP